MDNQDLENKILYAKTINSEWKLNTELVEKSFSERCASLNTSYETSLSSYLFNFTLKKQNSLSCFLEDYLQLINNQPSWKLALSNSGDYLAVLQDKAVEIYSSDNNYSDKVAQWQLQRKDLFPQWRCLVWSPDDSLILFSDSFGIVFIYESFGGLLACIPPSSKMCSDLSQGMCSLVVRELRSYKQSSDADDQYGSFELMCFSYSGELSVYSISLIGEVRMMHSFDFTDIYPRGITVATYLPSSSLFLIGGKSIDLDDFVEEGKNEDKKEVEDEKCGDHNVRKRDRESGKTNAENVAPTRVGGSKYYGLSLWRALSGYPYYKLVGDDAEYVISTANAFSLSQSLSWIASWWWGGKYGDQVYKMALSPNNQRLLTLHTSHCICLWSLPGLKLLKLHSFEDQLVAANVEINDPQKPFVTDVEWWNDEAIVLVQNTGLVTVRNVLSLENLFLSPEQFHVCCRVLMFNCGNFCILESDRKEGKRSYIHNTSDPANQTTDAQLSNESDINNDSSINDSLAYDEMEDEGVNSMVRKVMHYITDSDSFQDSKKTRYQHRIYRLYNIKQTTPDQLYSAKLDNDEFEEALLLAERYSLDTDLAYQKQWKKSQVTSETIEKYLTKVKNTKWSLHESIARVPTTLEATKELLMFGLNRTSLSSLYLMGGEDDGNDYSDEELVNKIDFENLTVAQKEMASLRQKLLNYSDRLRTYEAILPTADQFSNDTFSINRSLTVVQLAANYARASDCKALEKVLTHHTDQVLPHWLALLSNFPETSPPSEYASVLPSFDSKGNMKQVTSAKWRTEQDWCEKYCSFLAASNSCDVADFLYNEEPSLLHFKDGLNDANKVKEWYKERCKVIESYSGRVDYALQLVDIAIKNNVKGLEELHTTLTTMHTLVYKCKVSHDVSVDSLSTMSHLQIMHLFMPKPKRDSLVRDLRTWVLPYINDKPDKDQLLQQFILSLAMKDLSFLELILKESIPEKADGILKNGEMKSHVVQTCLYEYQECDQLGMVKSIISFLPESQIKTSLECHLLGSEILHRNDVDMGLGKVKQIQKAEKEVHQLFTRMARSAVKKEFSMKTDDLKSLLNDMLTLRQRVFESMDEAACYELFVSSLLCSGNEEYIHLAGSIIHDSVNQSTSTSNNSPYTYKSLKMFSSAATGLKDSLKSFSSISPFHKNHPSSGLNPSSIITHHLLDRETVSKLLLQAAREYFNSSSSVDESNMKLARKCLDLLEDKPKEILDELRLIEGVAMLESFGVTMLPVQIRLAEKKLEVIKKLLSNKRMLYKNLNKLLELARLLNMDNNIGKDDDEVKGRVLVLCAEAALNAEDYASCSEYCKRLVSMSFTDGWSVCEKIALKKEFKNLDEKISFLSFSLLHASDNQVEIIITALSYLKSQKLQEKLEAQAELSNAKQPSELDSSGEQASPINQQQLILDQTKTVISRTNEVVKGVFSSFKNLSWWSGVVNSATEQIKTFTEFQYVPRNKTKKFELMDPYKPRVCVHAFYQSVYKNEQSKPLVDYMSSDYLASCTASPSSSSILTYFLNNTTYSTDEHIIPVILNLAEKTLPYDTALTLAYLLSLPEPLKAESFFESMKDVLFKHQLALLYYSFVLANWLPQKEQLFNNENCLKNPNILMEKVYTSVSQNNSWPENVENIVKLYKKHFDWIKEHLEKIKKDNLSKKLSPKKPEKVKVGENLKPKDKETLKSDNEPKSNQNNIFEPNLLKQHQTPVFPGLPKSDSTSSNTTQFQKTTKEPHLFEKSYNKGIQDEKKKRELEKSALNKESSQNVPFSNDTNVASLVFAESHVTYENVEVQDSLNTPSQSHNEANVSPEKTLKPLNTIEESESSNEQKIITESIDNELLPVGVDTPNTQQEELSNDDSNVVSNTSISTDSQPHLQTADDYVVSQNLESSQEVFGEGYRQHEEIPVRQAQAEEINPKPEKLKETTESKEKSSSSSTNVEEPQTRKTFDETMESFIEEGQDIEAGSLYMRWKAAHPSFNNLNAAFAFAHKFRKNGK